MLRLICVQVLVCGIPALCARAVSRPRSTA